MKKEKIKVGEKYGKIKIINVYGRKTAKGRPHSRCDFICDCGKVVYEANAASIKRGNRKSCGCMKPKMNTHCHWKGYEEISYTYWGRITRQAEMRGLLFDVTIGEAWELFLKQERKCGLSGVELNFMSDSHTYDATASLDRIDSSQGYIEGNIQWVHKDLNTMKWDYTTEEFIEWCRLVSQYNNRAA